VNSTWLNTNIISLASSCRVESGKILQLMQSRVAFGYTEQVTAAACLLGRVSVVILVFGRMNLEEKLKYLWAAKLLLRAEAEPSTEDVSNEPLPSNFSCLVSLDLHSLWGKLCLSKLCTALNSL
jgi:hypothetical protein